MTILQILVAARWVHFAGLFVLFGCPLSFLVVRGADKTDAARIGNSLHRLLPIIAAAAGISGLVWIAALIANMAGSFAEAATGETLQAFFFETQFGPIVIVRLVLLFVAMVVLVLPRNIRFGTWLVVSTGLLINQAWLGHAANGGASLFGALMIGIYAVHVLAAAAWVGGLPVLLFALFSGRRARRADDNAAILSRYSTLATGAVTLILLSGVANALFRVHGQFGRLYATGYGDILAIKLLLVALMLGLASYNRFIAMPRLGAATPESAPANLGRSIGAELILGVLVIGAAALLGVTPPPD
ncbi:MAG: CopD family protein [Methylovirgula sp.]|uniref:CopD family protein n=1 Tax=Methylovirgula sp. TaxID=1978224 RepID=UPI00307601A1